MSLFDDLATSENLNYAWKKARTLFQNSDGYIDSGEITAFELNLGRELAAIQAEFRSNSYVLRPLRPLPRPKKLDKGTFANRQYFHVSVRDQVAWIAVVNILGPRLDPLMPAWSYGNRIYRAAWLDDGEKPQSKKLEIGPYRHASGHLYRKFQHSWPLFRRHVVRTARLMTGVRSQGSPITEEDEAEEKAFLAGQTDDLAYFRSRFWRKPKNLTGSDLFYASIDLERFFPNISRMTIRKALVANLPVTERAAFDVLILRMLAFELDLSDVPHHLFANVEPLFSEFTGNKGIPTGLFAAGFLANAVMIPVDQKINAFLEKKRSVAHFRYVDDHTILAYNFDELCEWIRQYRRLIEEEQVGASINWDKFDPTSLGDYLKLTEENNTAEKSNAVEAARLKAQDETRIDGFNPTKLLTKTLGQVSAIAAGNVHIMDDDDLKERLKLLEWLLLADIPEREIRPDTRAAFAAGQIALLVPLIVQESDGLIDKAREVADLERERQEFERNGAPKAQLKGIDSKIKLATSELRKKEIENQKHEKSQYRHCFSLLMRAFKEFPGKPRLFYRLCHYCLLTGHPGLKEIALWIVEQRDRDNVWADYYAGLTLQILSDTLLRASRTMLSQDALLSDQRAARAHVQDIADINEKAFVVPSERAAWFHEIGRKELFASLTAVAALSDALEDKPLARRLYGAAVRLSKLPQQADEIAPSWISMTGWPAGIWAEVTERKLSLAGRPSPVWERLFLPALDAGTELDVLAMRRYPELLPEEWWRRYLSPQAYIPIDDAGWWREAIAPHPNRRAEAESASHDAIRIAAHSLNASSSAADGAGTNSALEWLEYVRTLSPFDPRRSEWTALEILRGLIANLSDDLFAGSDALDNLHPANVLVPASWFTTFDTSIPSWEVWRNHTRKASTKVRNPEGRLVDYRFLATGTDSTTDDWLGQRVGIGRLLLGLLQFDFGGPRIWNIRGNEHAHPFSRRAAYERLAISSLTLLILEGCLSARSIENFQLASRPRLFGEDNSPTLHDVDFDAPPLNDPGAVGESIKHAQAALEKNQIAVSGNQPRQLIPFRLEDFALGEAGIQQEDNDAQ
ncbi:RNA-directed DNA polymerase (plasmid) [Rhizobium leguminosarum]